MRTRIPLLPFACAFLVGRWLADGCPPQVWPGVSLLLLGAVVGIALWMNMPTVSRVGLISLFGVLGYVAAPPTPRTDDARYCWLDGEGRGVFEGLVEETRARADGRARVVVQVDRVCGAEGDEEVLARVLLTWNGTPPTEGRLVRFRTRFRRFRDSGNPGARNAAHANIRQGLVRRGSVQEGDWVYVVRNRGMERLSRQPTWVQRLFRWRAQIRTRLRTAYLAMTPRRTLGLTLGLALGDRSEIDEETRDAFARAGLAHILAISGTHMALVALGLEALARQAVLWSPFRHRLPAPALAPLAAAAGVALFAFLVGLTPAIGRAVLMALVVLTYRSASWRVEGLAVLVLAALVIPVVDPLALWDVGFQLSFVSVLFLIRLVPAMNQEVSRWQDRIPYPGGRTGKVLRTAVERTLQLLLVSAIATVGTAPLCVYYFETIPWSGVLANLLGVPLVAGLGLPLVLTAGCLALAGLPGVHQLLTVSDAVLTAGTQVAVFFGTHPLFAPYDVCLPPLELAAFSALAGLCLLLAPRYWWSGPAAVAGMASILWFHHLPPAPAGTFRVTQLDVGQGDCSILRFPDGTIAVLDGGGSPVFGSNPALPRQDHPSQTTRKAFDPGKRIIAPYLRRNGYRAVDLMILSHPHPDHIGGLLGLAETLPIHEAWIPEVPARPGPLAHLVNILLAKHVPVLVRNADTPVEERAGVRFRFLHPHHGWRTRMQTRRGRSVNNGSMVMVATYGQVDFLFTGDIEAEVESLLDQSGALSRVEVVKVPHHGSDTSSTAALVEATRPRVAVIGVGYDNRFGFPRRATLQRWRRADTAIYRTDLDGAIDITTDGKELLVRSHRGGHGVHGFQAFEATGAPAFRPVAQDES